SLHDALPIFLVVLKDVKSVFCPVQIISVHLLLLPCVKPPFFIIETSFSFLRNDYTPYQLRCSSLRSIQTFLVCVYISNAWIPSSLPNPLCFVPQTGATLSSILNVLTYTVPDCKPFTIRCARFRFSVHIPEVRPYSVSFAFCNASSSSLNLITDNTGPKISSLAIVISLETFSKTVGVKKFPLSTFALSPPMTSFAP